MAELATAAFAALAPAATAATTSVGSWLAGTTVTTAAGATTALAPAAAITSGGLSALQTIATVGSMAATIFGGVGASAQAKQQAALEEINAGQDLLEARERALRVKRDLVEKVGATRVAFAGSGLDISSGGPIERGLESDANFEIGLAETSGEIKAAGSLARAAGYRTRAATSLVTSAAKALGQAGRAGVDIARRG